MRAGDRSRQVGGDQHGHHPGDCEGCVRLHPGEAGVRVGRDGGLGVQAPGGQGQVADEGGAAAGQRVEVLASHRSTSCQAKPGYRAATCATTTCPRRRAL